TVVRAAGAGRGDGGRWAVGGDPGVGRGARRGSGRGRHVVRGPGGTGASERACHVGGTRRTWRFSAASGLRPRERAVVREAAGFLPCRRDPDAVERFG